MNETAWWPHTTNTRIASHRLRCRQVIKELSKLGQDVRLFKGEGDSSPTTLVLSKRYDSKTLEIAESLRKAAGTRLALDLCDNHFWFQEDRDGTLTKRRDQLIRACRSVDLVIASSDALAAQVQSHTNANRIAVIPDAAESPNIPNLGLRLLHWRDRLELLKLNRWVENARIPIQRRLVWFGNQGSDGVEGGMSDLRSIYTALASAHSRRPLSLTVISNNRQRFIELTSDWSIPTHYMPWSAWTFSEALATHSTAVIPILKNPFTECKTANRVISAALHGLNVFADGIPSYLPFQSCCVLDDWEQALNEYTENPSRRKSDLTAALGIVQANYTATRIAMQWQAAIESIDGTRKG